MMINDKCETCDNLGKVYGLSQETFCDGCIYHENWKKNHYSPINKDDSQQPPEAGDGHWQPIETAPKDSMILLDIGYPYAVVGAWNEREYEWVYSSMQVNCCNSQYNDPYFENEYEKETEVKGWMPLPEVPHEKATP